MAIVIQSTNCLTGWRDACSYIIKNGDGHNLIMAISTPLVYNNNHLDEIISCGIISKTNLRDVENTIFPQRLWNRLQPDRVQFYDSHQKLYNRGKTLHARNKSLWGNYFLRFTKFGIRQSNQLENIIQAINSRQAQYAACYLMHVSSADTDVNTRNMGGPCLQYVQFALDGNNINLTAVYRNHDFLNKALGNYIGLSKLLEFVCSQTRRNIGTFTCHSIHYFLYEKRKVQNCINNFTW